MSSYNLHVHVSRTLITYNYKYKERTTVFTLKVQLEPFNKIFLQFSPKDQSQSGIWRHWSVITCSIFIILKFMFVWLIGFVRIKDMNFPKKVHILYSSFYFHFSFFVSKWHASEFSVSGLDLIWRGNWWTVEGESRYFCHFLNRNHSVGRQGKAKEKCMEPNKERRRGKYDGKDTFFQGFCQ